MNNRFLNKYGSWAIVTGASDGIGRSMALELASRGLNIFLVARRRDILDKLKNEIETKFSVKAEILSLDLGASASNQELFEKTQGLDVGLFAAVAGFGTSGPFIQLSPAQELNMIDLNCRSVVEQTHHFANVFKEKRRGGIILMGSLVGFQGVPLSTTYAASKAFIQSFAEGLYFELRPLGIDVLCSAPGPVHSGFAGRARMNMTQAATPEIIAGRTIASLGKRITVRPGFLSKLLGWSLVALPRFWRIKIMAMIMGKMAAK